MCTRATGYGDSQELPEPGAQGAGGRGGSRQIRVDRAQESGSTASSTDRRNTEKGSSSTDFSVKEIL